MTGPAPQTPESQAEQARPCMYRCVERPDQIPDERSRLGAVLIPWVHGPADPGSHGAGSASTGWSELVLTADRRLSSAAALKVTSPPIARPTAPRP